MSRLLLEKTRKINKLLQKTSPQLVVFSDICDVLSEVVSSAVLIINTKGKILGMSQLQLWNLDLFSGAKIHDIIDADINAQLLKFRDTEANIISDEILKNVFPSETPENSDLYSTIVPIYCGGERLGTLLMLRMTDPFDEGDLVMVEYGATVVGMEVLIAKQEEFRIKQAENETDIRKKAIVQLAIGTLSYSELEAIIHIFKELEGDEGLLVASKIADRAKITRSVIVNALRKFESAGLIEARSLGMKGTHIKIINDKLLEELKKINSKN